MNEYTEIKIVEGTEAEINMQLGHGWVLIGIEQRRDWFEPTAFEDKTKYILGKNVEEN